MFVPCRVKKAHKCRCGKSYKTQQSLRNHAITQHGPVAAALMMKTSSPITTTLGAPVAQVGIGIPVSNLGTTIPLMTTVSQVASVIAEGKVKSMIPKPGTVAAAVALQAANAGTTVSQILSQIPVTQSIIEQLPAEVIIEAQAQVT